MTLRNRALISSAFLVLLPLLVLTLLIRGHVGRLLDRQFAERTAVLAASVEADLAGSGQALHDRLRALAARLADDNRFRQALAESDAGARAYLIDYGERTMPLLGLAVLQIRDESGAVLTSGHFREEHGWGDPGLCRTIRALEPHPALIAVHTPAGPFLALTAVDSLVLGGRRLHLLGGVRVDERWLNGLAGRGGGVVSLLYPEPDGSSGVLSSDPELGRALGEALVLREGEPAVHLPEAGHAHRTWTTPLLLASGSRPHRTGSAVWVVSQPRAPWTALVASLDRWLLAVLAASAAGMLALAAWLSLRVTRPLEELARRTATIDLDHLAIGFETRRRDEVGALARLLAAMTERLRGSAERLRDAERRATLGEVARQVNHDIRNGLAPIRNVVRHLGEVARESPERSAAVFAERQPVLESSVAYLESLAANYARLSSRPAQRACDVGALVREVTASAAATHTVRAIAAPGLAPVLADPVGLRRILENLVRNAVESLGDRGGEVRVLADNASDEDGRAGVRIVVSDTGPGIAPEALGRIFDDFYTTKATGAGLGLSIVRRLVTDYQGTVRADSAIGEGATFTVWLPAAERELLTAQRPAR